MPEIYVQRGDGLLRGPDIIDPLMSETTVQIQRGKTAIDRSSDLQKVYLNCKYRGQVRRGQLAEILDNLQGVAYRGKIVGVAYRTRGTAVILEVTIQRVSP